METVDNMELTLDWLSFSDDCVQEDVQDYVSNSRFHSDKSIWNDIHYRNGISQKRKVKCKERLDYQMDSIDIEQTIDVL